MTADLVDFLRARLADDERIAREAAGWSGDPGYCVAAHPISTHIARHDPARVRREVAAKRAILGRAVMCKGDYWRQYEHFVLKPLAAVYDDHPEFRDEWRV